MRWMGAMALCALVAAPLQAEERRIERRILRGDAAGGRLGVMLEDVDAETVKRLKLPAERGALIREVEAGLPAAKAGLLADDVVITCDGDSVRSAAHLARLVRETPAGRAVALAVVRGGSIRKLTATVERGRAVALGWPELSERLERLPEIAGDRLRRLSWRELGGSSRLGVSITELTAQLATHYGVKGGVLVTEVGEGSPAAKAGLRAGDIVTSVDGEALHDAGALRARVQRGGNLRIGVTRDGKPMDVTVTLPGTEDDEPTI